MMAYASSEDHPTYSLDASDFDKLNRTLIEKYGAWESDIDNDPQSELRRKAGMTPDLGIQLIRSGFQKTVVWQTRRTVIEHRITNSSNGVAHTLIYHSIEAYNKKRESALDDI